MFLDRTKNIGGKGKYALIKLREIDGPWDTPEALANAILKNPNCVDYGYAGADSEFFVIRLKDKHAAKALDAYAESIAEDDPEFSDEVTGLAVRASIRPSKKSPD